LGKDVIGLRVSLEVKQAWDNNLTNEDKEKIKAIVEELILLHQAGFSFELVKRELDSLRAEICPRLLKAVEYMMKSSCIIRCYDDYLRKYFFDVEYLAQQLCKTHPARPSSTKV